MPVVESPYWDSWPVSAPGSEPEGNFVLMKIDPVASVAIFEDEETTQAAAALERHEWVLGLVTSPTPGLPDADGKETMSLWIELIGQGPPKDKPISSLPFAPSPQLYDDRPPIELQPRLPWSDLYLHTYYTSSVLISRIHHGPGYFPVRLTEEEYMPIRRRGFQDRGNWKKLPPVTVEAEVDAIPTMDLAGGSFASTGSTHSSDGSEESSSSGESTYAEQRKDMGMKLLKARIYAEISLDPATCPGPLGSPADVAEPIRRIRELWTGWQDRMTTEMLAKRPATNAWIQGVEAARKGSESGFDMLGTEEAPLDDTAVLPDDAVDETYERIRSADHRRRSSEPDPILINPSGPGPPSHPATAETPPSFGPPALTLPISAPGDGDANSVGSAPATQVAGTATDVSAAAGSAPSQPSAPPHAPETTATSIPAHSSQNARISIIQRVLQVGRRVKPAAVRARVGMKLMFATRSKTRASTQ